MELEFTVQRCSSARFGRRERAQKEKNTVPANAEDVSQSNQEKGKMDDREQEGYRPKSARSASGQSVSRMATG